MQPFILAQRERIAELCRTHHVRRLSIFGSAVRDDFDPERSDVDVRVEFAREFIDDYLANSDDFRDGLTELFGRKVDLLSAQTIQNRYLRREIEASQVVVYAA